MSSLKFPETDKPRGASRKHIMVSNLNFHFRIIERHSPVKKRFLSFPLLFFREGSGKGQVWKNQFLFSIHFRLLKQILFRAAKNEMRVKDRLLQFSLLKGEHDIYPGRTDFRSTIPKNRDTDRKTIPHTQKSFHFQDSSENEKFYPITSPVATANILHGKTPGRNLIYSLVSTSEIAQEKAVFTLFSGWKRRKTINKAYLRKKTSGKFLKISSLSKREVQVLNQPGLENIASRNVLSEKYAVPGEAFSGRKAMAGKVFQIRNPVSRKTLPDRAAVYRGLALLSPTYFPKLEVSLNSRLVAFPDPVFEPEPVSERFPAKEVYHLVSGKELAFNTGDKVKQELEREMEAIKEEVLQVGRAAQASYSSIYSKLEEELKKKFEINRISEQVIQQIVWKLKIEKERRGLL